MNAYERRRRIAPLVWTFVVLLLIPPSAVQADNRRIHALSRDGKLETFRNPQISSASENRFLFTMGPQALVGSGGDSFNAPQSHSYGSVAEPAAHWISYKGRLEWSNVDLALRGVGLPLVFQRIYRGSVSEYTGPLGNEWEFNWNKRLKYDASGSPTRVWFYDMGRREEYELDGGSYVSPIGRYDTLVRTGTPEYVRTDREGLVETYEQEAYPDEDWFRLKEIEDRNGNRLTFAYDDDSRLTRVGDTLDRDTTLAYDTNDRITKITDPMSREWVYGFDGSGRLTSVRTPTVNAAGDEDDYLSGKTTSYAYDGSGQLTAVFRPGDGGTPTWVWAYDGSTRITKETRAGNDTLLTYDDGNKKVTVTDREGEVTVYFYDDGHEGNLITKRRVYEDEENYWESSFDYDAAGNVTRAIFPKGNRVEYVFDGSGNVVTVNFKKDGSDGGPVRWVYTWAAYARLSTLKDPNGNVWDYDYDGSGNLITKTAPAVTLPNSDHGTIRETWAYNGRGLVTAATDPVGTVTEMTYTTVNALAAFPHEIVRDAGGLELATTYLYDAAGNVTSVEDPNGNVTTYVVNELNQVLSALEPLGVSRKTHYDEKNRVTKTEASNDTQTGDAWFVMDQVYDAQDNLLLAIADVEDAHRVTTAYAYDKNFRLTKTTSPEDRETVYSYDPRNLQVAVTRKAASSVDDAITAAVYDGNGNRITSTDPRGNHTLYAYDGYDRLTKVTQPLGNYSEMLYDSAGNVITSRRKNAGNTLLTETVTRYDQANRVYETETLAKKADLSTDIGDGWQTKTVHRDEAGRVLTHSGDICGCGLFEHVYDAVGRQVTSKDPMGATDGTRNLVLSFHDKNGNVTKSIRKERSQDTGIEADKDIETNFVFDARNRLVTRKEKLGGTDMETVYFYGKRDQLTRVVDGNGDERRTEHNEQLWTTKDIAENGAADVETQYDYDDDGLMITYRAKNATTGDQSTVYSHDALGRVVTTTWPPNPTTALSTIQTWDKAGNRINTTDPMGTVVVAAYDANNRLTSKAITPGSGVLGTTSRDYGYDGANRLTSADSADGVAFASVVERTYNTLGEIETEKQVLDGYASGAGRTITYVYDIHGSRISTIYPVSGDTIELERDALDRVAEITRNGSELAAYTFNGSRRIAVAYPESHGIYLYDGYGRVTDIHHKNTDSGNTLALFEYGWDKSHQITGWDRHYYDDVQNTRITTNADDLGSQFLYDGAKRLVSVLRGVPSNKMGETFATNLANDDFRRFAETVYDQTGNRVTLLDDDGTSVDEDVWTHNKANEIATENANAVTHNATGNFTGPSNKWGYDFENRLVQYLDDGDPTITHTWRFDALGRRVQWGNSSTSRVFRQYYDGDQIVEHVSFNAGTETLRKQYIWGERLDDLVYYKDITTETVTESWAHTDHLQSVQVLADEAGDIREGYRYQEWGQTTVVDDSFATLTGTVAPSSNNVRFTGRDQYTVMGNENDSFYHNRARVNRTRWGRWLQRDPIGYVDGGNVYRYVKSSPLNATDPAGKQAWSPGVGGVWTAGTPGTTTSTPNGGTIYWTPDPLNPLDLCNDVCAKAKALGLDYGHLGGVICCNGRKYACVWGDGGATTEEGKKIIHRCVEEHEITHFSDVVCPETGIDRPPFKPGVDPDAEECEGYSAELACLYRKLPDCGSDAACTSEVQKRITFVKNKINEKCKP